MLIKRNKMGNVWEKDFDAMARKTVYRELIGKWGVMSIDYQNSQDGMNLAEQMKEDYIDNPIVNAEQVIVNAETGEAKDDAK